MKGFFNRYLIVDVTSGTSSIEAIQDDLLAKYLGGKGLATHLLMKHQPAGALPFSPENPLIIGTGPVNDTAIFGSSRYAIYTKSPLTGVYLGSYSGGKVPEKISRTGFDAIVILGKSNRLAYLEITPEGAVLRDASSLKGKDCIETETLLMQHYGKNAGAIVIGPAGENLVPFSIISNDFWRCAGRGGGGAVLGSKNIKAVVFVGDRKRDLADPEGVVSFAKETLESKKDSATTNAYKLKGTPIMVDVMNDIGAFPTRYWRQGYFDKYKAINAGAMQERMEVRLNACARCFIACGKLSTVKDGPHKGLRIEGPEYETLYAFGGLCMIDDITEIAYLNDLCDRLGMDTITAGNLVALVMEASAMGKIKTQIPYGDAAAAAQLLNDTAQKKGVGEVLAQGIKVAAREFDMQEEAIHVKGMEPAGYDPRFLKGMSLAYATSDRGACHLRSTFYRAELSGMIKPETMEGKVSIFLDFEDRLTLFDTLIFCRFYRDFYLWNELRQIVKITTGLDLTKEQLQETASRVTDLVRSYNIREGVTAEDDVLPRRFFTEPLPDGGYVVNEDDFIRLKAEYYQMRGWDKQGVPKKS